MKIETREYFVSAPEAIEKIVGGAIATGTVTNDGLEPEKDEYSNILQGPGIHGLIASSTANQAMQIDAITHAATMKSDGVIITIDEEAIRSISPQTFKVLIILLTRATEQLPRGDQATAEAINKGRTVKLRLKDYADACKISDMKSARAQLNTAVSTLYGLSLEWDEEVYERPEGKGRKRKILKHHQLRITDHIIKKDDEAPVKSGSVEFKFSFDMAEYLANAYIMPYPDNLLSINTHSHPYSIPLGWKLCALHNVNWADQTRRNSTTVEALLSAAKGIPLYKDISKTGQIFDRIIKPFDRDLQELLSAGVLSEFWYYDDEGRQISRNELLRITYQDFIKLNVHYVLKDYPDQTPRIEAKNRRISAAIKRRKAASKKKETEKTTEGEA